MKLRLDAIRAAASRTRSPMASLLELAGLAGIVYGVSRIYLPAAFIVFGFLAVGSALALERPR